MKYLYFKTKGIAIPLAALQACADLRFVGSDYISGKDGESGKTVYYADPSHDYFSREAVVIDESEIMAQRPKQEEE